MVLLHSRSGKNSDDWRNLNYVITLEKIQPSNVVGVLLVL